MFWGVWKKELLNFALLLGVWNSTISFPVSLVIISHFQDMEAEVNVHYSELINSKSCDQLLTNQVQRLMMCFDVYLETDETTQEGPVEFGKEKVYPRVTRFVSARASPLQFSNEASGKSLPADGCSLDSYCCWFACLQGTKQRETLQVQLAAGIFHSEIKQRIKFEIKRDFVSLLAKRKTKKSWINRFCDTNATLW